MIKEFLIDNYIWIIIIIILSIITIIGFLADKKKNQTKRANTMGGTIENQNPNMNPSNMTYQPQPNMNQPINYQQENNNLLGLQPNPMPNNIVNNQLQPDNNLNSQINNINPPINNNVGPMNIQQPVMPNGQVVNEMNYNAPQPVEPLNAAINQPAETMYQPLSEQTPSFNPVDPNVNAMNNLMPNGQLANQMPNGQMAEPINMQPLQTGNIMQPTQVDPMVMATNPMNNPMPQPIPNPEGNTIPNPITPPQPVSPQPINYMYGNQNNNGSMQ